MNETNKHQQQAQNDKEQRHENCHRTQTADNAVKNKPWYHDGKEEERNHHARKLLRKVVFFE